MLFRRISISCTYS